MRTLAGTIEGDPICARLEIRPEQLDDQHPATRRLSAARRTWLLASCRPVETGPPDPPNDWSRSRLIRTPAEAWVDRPGGRPFTPDPDERRGSPKLGFAHLVYPGALHSRFLHALGIDYQQEFITPIGRPLSYSPGKPIPQLIARTA